MKSKKKIVIIVIIGLFLLTTGITFALWSNTSVQTKANTINTGCFSTTYEENSSAISILNTYPISDEQGKTLETFTFTITNTCPTDASYTINLNLLNTTTISPSAIKAVLNEEQPKLLTDYILVESSINDSTQAYILKSGTLAAASSSGSADGGKAVYSLRLWLDENMAEADMGKTFSGKIVVMATPQYSTDE